MIIDLHCHGAKAISSVKRYACYAKTAELWGIPLTEKSVITGNFFTVFRIPTVRAITIRTGTTGTVRLLQNFRYKRNYRK